MSRQITTITLRALQGEPLRQDRVCEMVEATARAIAERQGIGVVDLSTEPASITITLEARRIEALGFAAELRRLTNNWYTQKFGADNLWGRSRRRDVMEQEGGDQSGPRDNGDSGAADDEQWLGDPDAWKDR